MNYGFSLVLPRENAALAQFVGERYTRRDGMIQIFTTEDQALALAKRLADERVRFSLNPVTLDDVFNFVIAREKVEGGAR